MNPISPQRRRVRGGAPGIIKGLGALCASAVILFAYNLAMAQRLHEVPLTDVKLQGEFWGPKLETNRTVTIPHCFKECEQTGRIANFIRAAGIEKGPHQGAVFNDSDVYKTIEAEAYSLGTH